MKSFIPITIMKILISTVFPMLWSTIYFTKVIATTFHLAIRRKSYVWFSN